MRNYWENIAKIIKRRVNDSGFKQAEFARSLGLRPQQVNDWLSCRSTPNFNSGLDLCISAGVDLKAIIRRTRDDRDDERAEPIELELVRRDTGILLESIREDLREYLWSRTLTRELSPTKESIVRLLSTLKDDEAAYYLDLIQTQLRAEGRLPKGSSTPDQANES